MILEEEEKHLWEREISIGCLSYMPQTGIEPATQARALTGIELVTFLFIGRHKPPQVSHTGLGPGLLS